MKRTFKFFAFAAAAVAMLSACQKVELVNPAEEGIHFFVTADTVEPIDAEATKTAVVDGTNPYVKWLDTDGIKVWEYVDGAKKNYFNSSSITISQDEKTATFDLRLFGEASGENFTYTAIYPTNGVQYQESFCYFEIPSSQTLKDGNLASNADILIGKPIVKTSRISELENLSFQFKRPGTVVRLSLKGITAGEKISIVKLTAPEANDIAGRCKINLETAEVSDKAYYGGTNVIYLNCGGLVATGTDVIYFRCLDGTWAGGSEVSIKVVTDAADYTKTATLPNDYVFSDGGLTKFGFSNMTRESNVGSSTFDLLSGELVEGDYIICSGSIAMKNSISSDRATYETVTITDGKISNPDQSLIWHIAPSGDNWTIYNAAANAYAASTGAKNKMQLTSEGDDTKTLWTATYSDGNFEFVNKFNAERGVNANLRYNNNYGFACYGTGTGSSLNLYMSHQSTLQKLATPDVTVVGDEIEWDAIENAGSYRVEVAGKTLTCTENTYIYSASDFEGVGAGYYAVTVTAIPSDPTAYQESEPGAGDARFMVGTPTLATPVLVQGEVTESSITLSWIPDPNATEGYSCYIDPEDYDEISFGEGNGSVTISGLNANTEYTILVAAEPVTGDEPWAASETAEITVKTAEAGSSAETWTKVISAPSDWSGEYLLVYEDDNYAWTGEDAGQCHVDVTINNGVISEKPETAAVLTIAQMEGGYSIRVNNDQYIGKSAYSNGMDFSANPLLNTLSIESYGTIITAEGGCIMRYNSTSGSSNERFRYYKSGQQPVQLYKKTSSGPVAEVSVTGVTLNQSSVTIVEGETLNLTATVAPTNATNKKVTWESSNTSVATVSGGTVTAVAAGSAAITATTEDGGFTATCNVTVNAATILTTMDEIFGAATEAGSTEEPVKVTFNNWVVSALKNTKNNDKCNIYVTDGTKGFIMFLDTVDHGLVVGSILSGSGVDCNVKLYNGSAELVDVNINDISSTTGGTLTPQVVSIADLSGINTGAVITVNNVTYNNEVLSDGENEITPYNSLYEFTEFSNGLKYNVTGIYVQYDTSRDSKKEICPRSAADIEEVQAVKYSITVVTGLEHGSIAADVAEAPAGAEVSLTANPDTGYHLALWNVSFGDNQTITVDANNKFIMPEADVTVSATFEKDTAATKDASIDFSAQGYTNGQEITSATIGDDVSVTFAKGSNSNAPKYYTTGTAIRAYGGNSFTVATNNEKNITSITLIFGSSDGTNAITASPDSFSSPTWTGRASSVTFTIGGTSGNRRIKGISVTYEN